MPKLTVKVSDDELRAWRSQAHRQEMTLSAWVRYVLSGYTRAQQKKVA